MILTQTVKFHINRVHNRLSTRFSTRNDINDERVPRAHRLLTLHPILLYTHLTLHAPPFILIHRFILLRTIDVYYRLVLQQCYNTYFIVKYIKNVEYFNAPVIKDL